MQDLGRRKCMRVREEDEEGRGAAVEEEAEEEGAERMGRRRRVLSPRTFEAFLVRTRARMPFSKLKGCWSISHLL